MSGTRNDINNACRDDRANRVYRGTRTILALVILWYASLPTRRTVRDPFYTRFAIIERFYSRIDPTTIPRRDAARRELAASAFTVSFTSLYYFRRKYFMRCANGFVSTLYFFFNYAAQNDTRISYGTNAQLSSRCIFH